MKKQGDLKIIQEDTVRQLVFRDGITQLVVEPTTYLTPGAKAYMKERGIALSVSSSDLAPVLMEQEAASGSQEEQLSVEKPEHMTSLAGSVLVKKNHHRIILRGKFDSFQGEIIKLQVEAEEKGDDQLVEDLEEILSFCRLLLRSEVTGDPVPEKLLLGLELAELREQSHHPEKYFGMGHHFPDYRMGTLGAGLNSLRTGAREVEIAAITAFCQDDAVERTDILRGLNRLSSALYILMIRQELKQRRGTSLDKNHVKDVVNQVVTEFFKEAAQGNTIPVEVSARHVHLSQQDVEALFGQGQTLTPARELSQPGQFLAKERLFIVTAKGELRNIAILGPARSKTQVELSATDARQIGVKAPLRLSGDNKGAPDLFLFSDGASVCAKEAVIVAQNHIHMTPADAERYEVSDQELVSVRLNTVRPITFENVVVRINEEYDLAMHIDSDEASACLFENGNLGTVIKKENV